ncbi:TPA: diguanylate cyclase [Vibrio vulnificus]|nr:diguanylate cyclase [Vibrio vulnificus]HDY7582664.1 diguanylate cyclase [Vibrio vulnificus]
MANKLNQLISTPVYVSTLCHEITIRASIGIVIYPDDSSSLSTLIELADKAMYRAKIANEPYMFVSEKGTAPTVL